MAVVRCGTLVSVCRDDDPNRRWVAHRMRTTVTGAVVGGSSGAVVIRAEGWLILTRMDKVKRSG